MFTCNHRPLPFPERYKTENHGISETTFLEWPSIHFLDPQGGRWSETAIGPPCLQHALRFGVVPTLSLNIFVKRRIGNTYHSANLIDRSGTIAYHANKWRFFQAGHNENYQDMWSNGVTF